MAKYNITHGGNHGSPNAPGCETNAKCLGLADDHCQLKADFLFRNTMCEAAQAVLARTNKKMSDLVVGDRLEINMPTFSVLESLRVHIDGPTGGFAFDVVDSFGRALTGIRRTTTYTVNAAGDIATQASAPGTGLPNGLGALPTRNVWDFTRQAALIDYDIPGGLEVVITALPAAGAGALAGLPISIFVGGRRTGICHGDRVGNVQTQA